MHTGMALMLIGCSVFSAPTVSVIPPVIAILPRDTRVILQCLTNSPSQAIEWVSTLDGPMEVLSTMPSYSLSVPAQGGFSDGETFYCVVRDPESERTIVQSARTVVQNIEG